MDLYSRQKINKSGFTLVEVIFAIVILTSSLVVLLGLQSSAIDKALRDRNQLDAMLLARSLLSALELEFKEKPPESSSVDSSVIQLLQDHNAVPPEDIAELEGFADFKAELRIEDWQTPPQLAEQIQTDKALMKKLYLRVYWSDLPDDQVDVVYFFPAK